MYRILEVAILLDMMYLKCTSKIRSEFSIILCAIYVTVRFPIVHVFFYDCENMLTCIHTLCHVYHYIGSMKH